MVDGMSGISFSSSPLFWTNSRHFIRCWTRSLLTCMKSKMNTFSISNNTNFIRIQKSEENLRHHLKHFYKQLTSPLPWGGKFYCAGCVCYRESPAAASARNHEPSPDPRWCKSRSIFKPFKEHTHRVRYTDSISIKGKKGTKFLPNKKKKKPWTWSHRHLRRRERRRRSEGKRRRTQDEGGKEEEGGEEQSGVEREASKG